MEAFTTKKIGSIEIVLSVEVNKNSQNADKAFENMHKLIDSSFGADNNADS